MFHFLKKTSQIADARLKFLKDNNYPRRYRRLIDPKATSDDEADPKGSVKDGRKVFYIKRRQERSAGAEEFIRRLDEVREQSARLDPSRKRFAERLRCIPTENQKSSAFQRLPEHMPIDYFDPTFYNRLQPRLRHSITTLQVALLPNSSQYFTRSADERLTDAQFMEKYGDAILAQYQIVAEDDLEDGDGDSGLQVEDLMDQDDDDSEDDEEDSEEDMYVKEDEEFDDDDFEADDVYEVGSSSKRRKLGGGRRHV